MMGNDTAFHKYKYVIRDCCEDDNEDIFLLSEMLNTVNLPANKAELELVVKNSENSFSMTEQDSTKRAFLFVLTEAEQRVIGTSQIFAKHGTLASPHLYFQVDQDERYSETLKKYFRHRTLRLCQSFDGPTEIGSLVLDKTYRSHGEKLGRNLSYVRFLFMAMKPELFSHQVLAELLPPLGPNFESALWDAIGRKFTGLDYYEADMISRKNKEFIKTLFPSVEMYVSMLPDSAQEVIGQVGRNSRGALHLLSKIGFRYSHRVDPFDGGPHYEAEQEDITLIQESCRGAVKKTMTTEGFTMGLCGRYDKHRRSGDRFRAVLAPFNYDAENGILYLDDEAIAVLGIAEGQPVTAIPVDG